MHRSGELMTRVFRLCAVVLTHLILAFTLVQMEILLVLILTTVHFVIDAMKLKRFKPPEILLA